MAAYLGCRMQATRAVVPAGTPSPGATHDSASSCADDQGRGAAVLSHSGYNPKTHMAIGLGCPPNVM